jgi:VCBS repeat-containing protein
VTDDSGQTATATVTVTVQPTGGDDLGTTPAGEPLDVDAPGVLLNDSGTGLSIAGLVDPPLHGTLTLNADGSYRYTPEAGFSGTDVFVYEGSDGAAQRYTQTVTITVVPAAGDDTTATNADTAVELPVGDLLDDDRGTALAVTAATDGTHGTVTVAPDGTLTYTPESGFSGQDTFTYTITGDGGSSTATVTVLVRPVAPDDEIRTRVDEAVDSATGRLLANARGTGLTVHGVTQPSHGTVTVDVDGTFHYTPAPGYVGRDSFEYALIDAFGTVVSGTVGIDVAPFLPNTGADPRLWTAGALLVLLAGLAFAAAARVRRRREA